MPGTQGEGVFRKLLRVGLLTVFTTMMVFGALWLFTPWQADLQQRQAEKAVEAGIKAYLQAVMRQDRQAALKLWDLSTPLPAGSEPPLRQRRERVTDDLLAMDLTGYTLFTPEWWTTCCEPHVTCSASSAGGARVRVQVLDAGGQPASYLFDVFAREQPYWGDALGNPPRHWLLRDVYLMQQSPLFWPFVFEATIRYVAPATGTP